MNPDVRYEIIPSPSLRSQTLEATENFEDIWKVEATENFEDIWKEITDAEPEIMAPEYEDKRRLTDSEKEARRARPEPKYESGPDVPKFYKRTTEFLNRKGVTLLVIPNKHSKQRSWSGELRGGGADGTPFHLGEAPTPVPPLAKPKRTKRKRVFSKKIVKKGV